MKKQSSTQFYRIVLAIWLTFSLGSVVLAVVSWMQLSTRLNATRQVMLARTVLSQVYESLLNLETGERGYVITGDKKFLEPFTLAQTNLPGQFNQLVVLVRENPAWLDSVTSLRADSGTIVGLQQAAVDARDKGFEKALATVSSAKLKAMMDDVRVRSITLDGKLQDRQEKLREEILQHAFRANLATLVAGVLALGTGLLVLWQARVATRHKERARKLIEAKLHAEHSNREKTAFLANVSHEIRTPMNAILGFSELLSSDLTSPRHQQYLQSIRSSAESLLQLINDILDMSKIEAGVMELRPEPTDLREICDFIRVMFAKATARKNLRLEWQVAADLPRAVLMDRIRLRQVLVNLVGNAVKFTDAGGIDVRVGWEKQSPPSHITLIIEVQDTGVGIPTDKLGVIFKPFVQSGVHSDKEKQGTGLGLAIVKRLTEAMGGSVTVASVMAQGSAFHLRFPNTPISQRLAVSDKKFPPAEVDFNALRSSSLLVVDDNQANCDLIAGMFNGSHHKLFFCTNGADAVARARDLKPDIVLMDIRMTGMDGYQALEGIRKTNGLELVPVIAVSASIVSDSESALKEKFSGCIRKPFTRYELFKELADFLPRHTEGANTANNSILHVPNSGPRPAPPELVSELQGLLAEPWPAIRDSVAVNESREFARSLEGLGQKWNCQPLVDYAQKLVHAADSYAVTDLEKHLGEFSALVESLSLDQIGTK